MTVTPLPPTSDPIALLQSALASLDIAADWVGMRMMREESVYRSQRDGKPEGNERSLNQGVMVEVLVQGQMGYAATHRLTVDGLRQAAAQAFQQAQAAVPWQIYPFQTDIRPSVQGGYRSPVKQPLHTLTAAHAHELLARICAGLKVSDKLVQASASITATA
ncbi:MAG TPA: DNA gyrase modulator, partial [Candidatus Obscuribacterales bacterium]